MSGVGGWAARRFWTEAAVVEAAGGFAVRLDGRALRTPAKSALVMPTRALAEAVAAEWAAQDERIDPGAMPATRLANSAIDKVTPQRDAVVAHLADYGQTDLLCYRAETPEVLAERQRQAWDPWLDWAAEAFGARLRPVAGVIPIAQDAAALRRLAAPLAAMGPFELTATHDLVGLSGSLVLGLAAAHGAAAPEALWEAACVDDAFQVERWGVDEEAAAADAAKRSGFLQAAGFFSLAQHLG